jgi:hypothetical protein
VETHLQVGVLDPPEQAETLDRKPLLPEVQQVQDRPVGLRQPGHRCLPAETGLDSHRAAHPGQGRRVPRRPVPGRVLGTPPPEGETPARPFRRAPAVQAGRAVQRMRGKPAHTRPATPVPRRLGTLVPADHQDGDHGGLPDRPRPASRRERYPGTPHTRHLPPAAAARGGGPVAPCQGSAPEPPLWGLLRPCAGTTRMHGPEGAPVQQCTGATRSRG